MTNYPQPHFERIPESFSNMVTRLMNEKGMKPSVLAKESTLSKTTISRICRNSNDKGDVYEPTQKIIMLLCIALKLTPAEGWGLFFAAFPELSFLNRILEKKMDLSDANEFLDAMGMDYIGNNKEF